MHVCFPYSHFLTDLAYLYKDFFSHCLKHQSRKKIHCLKHQSRKKMMQSEKELKMENSYFIINKRIYNLDLIFENYDLQVIKWGFFVK